MGASPSSSYSSTRSKNRHRRPKSVKHNLQATESSGLMHSLAGQRKANVLQCASLKDHVYSMLRQCLYQLPFPPDAITEDVVQRMAMAVERVEVIESQFVLLKGKRAKGIYVVTNGEAQVLSTQGDTIANLLPGDFFGELSTLFYIPCTATVQALEGTSLLLIKMEKLRQALGEEKVVSVELEDYFVRRKYFDTSGAVPQAENLEKIARLDMKKIPFFSKWGESAVKYVLDLVSPNSEVGPVTLIPPNTYICHEGEKVDEITIITKGLVASMQEKKMVSDLDANYWPLWFGEREHFTDRRSTITVRTITACQAVVIKFSEIAMAKNHYKDDLSTSLRYWNDKWRKKIAQLEKVGLSARNSAKVEIQVLIRKLHESGIVSNAPVALYHQLAMASLPKQCHDGAIVYEPKPVGGTTGRPKGRKKKNRMSDSVWSMTLEDAEQLIEDDDKLFLVLQGSIGVVGVNTTSFRSGLPVWVTVAKPVILEAKEQSLILQISGSTLLQATQMYPKVRLNLPPTVG